MPKKKAAAVTPAPSLAADSDDFDFDALKDTLRSRSRELTIVGVVVLVVGGGLFLWHQSVIQKDTRADSALNEAEGALSAGNRPLAVSELGKVADRYKDTAAGVEAAMVVAQLDFEDTRWADGVKTLEAVKSSTAIKSFASSVDGLIGGALADEKKYDDAVKSYLAAADEADFQSVKDNFRSDAARVMAMSGKKDDARKIWQDLASHPDSPAVAEAKIRLGELDAAVATKN